MISVCGQVWDSADANDSLSVAAALYAGTSIDTSGPFILDPFGPSATPRALVSRGRLDGFPYNVACGVARHSRNCRQQLALRTSSGHDVAAAGAVPTASRAQQPF